jgi:hypothetical protein
MRLLQLKQSRSHRLEGCRLMARYRKLDLRTWSDKKFRELSPLPPSGQSLWLYLVLGPHTTNIPGLFEASEISMADRLGWSLEAFREAFREASSKGMAKADWKARLVWLPNAPDYNKPESPNVVISWGSAFDELPECEIKWQAYQSLKAFTEGLGEAFSKAFAKAIPNQEQEQEQKQEQEQTKKPRKRAFDVGSVSGLNQEAWTKWVAYRTARKPAIRPVSMQEAAEELATFGAEQMTVVKKSIASGWQGLFAPKTNGKHVSPPSNDDATLAQAAAVAKEIGFRDRWPQESASAYLTAAKFERDSPPRRSPVDVSKLTAQMRMAK